MSCYMLTAIVVICWLYCTGEVYPRTGSGEDEDSGWRPLAGHRLGPGARRTIVETGNILTSTQRGHQLLQVNKVKLKKVLKHCAFRNVTAWTTE